MNSSLKTFFVAAALTASTALFAQLAIDTATPEKPAAAAPVLPEGELQTIEQNGQKFVLVSTIKTVEACTEFQKNVQIVNAKRQAAVNYKQRIEIALTTPEKEALQKLLDETLEKLEADNILMSKTYAFSLSRQYLVQIVKTRLYTPVSDEEFAKLSDEEKKNPDLIKVVEGKTKDKDGNETDVKQNLLYVASIDTVSGNDIFRQNVQLVQTQRNRVIQLEAAVKQVSDAAEKTKLEEELKKSLETLNANNEEMTKIYGFSLTRSYQIDIEELKLFTAITDEELAKAKEAKAADAASSATGATPAAK